ncbi:Hypothetical protein NTJ_15568 [Nesidiocoris tenuis]|uniref:Uncharacterized protein n=1 Tax=Nesidiocoris tenuis TaxID=355587 RepID=A0ABN7BGE8_9HEMI|nr:Hypothetical protein NTJ_15568 [Nesidiocoris tenuis]
MSERCDRNKSNPAAAFQSQVPLPHNGRLDCEVPHRLPVRQIHKYNIPHLGTREKETFSRGNDVENVIAVDCFPEKGENVVRMLVSSYNGRTDVFSGIVPNERIHNACRSIITPLLSLGFAGHLGRRQSGNRPFEWPLEASLGRRNSTLLGEAGTRVMTTQTVGSG